MPTRAGCRLAMAGGLETALQVAPTRGIDLAIHGQAWRGIRRDAAPVVPHQAVFFASVLTGDAICSYLYT